MLNERAVDAVFHALGDPTRRAILAQISARPASVTDLARPLGITLAAVVQHLRVLEDSGIVETRKLGRVRSCQLRPEGLVVAERWIRDRKATWERRFDRLEELLDGPPEPPAARAEASRALSPSPANRTRKKS